MADAPNSSLRSGDGKKRRHHDISHKRSVGRSRKKTFHGNRHTKGDKTASAKDTQPLKASSSRQKLRLSSTSVAAERRSKSPAQTETNGFRILSWSAMEELQKVISCKSCDGDIQISEESVRGLGFKLVLMCMKNCNPIRIDSSPQIGPQKNAYEVNTRSVLAMRMIRQGLTGLQTFCMLMDLPAPVAQSSFVAATKHLHAATKNVCDESLSRATTEEAALTCSNHLCVSGDGTWRRSGFNSLQGVATIIGNKTGGVLDFEVKSAYCKECELWEAKIGTQEYVDWLEDHIYNCQSNHEGSSGRMEVDAIVDIFKRSEAKFGVKYLCYIGDGDSKTFKEVCEAKPYGNDVMKKKECVGHVEKRFGTQVRKLKDKLKGKKLADGKDLTGKNRLTGKWIDKLQQYYGNAIRENSACVADMKNAIWATYFHYISTDSKPQHSCCPSSWCKWKIAKENRTLKKFKHSHDLPVECVKALKPAYDTLTDSDLLERCLGGFTQNSNKSLNNKIWTILPKRTFSGSLTLQLGVMLSVVTFNDGANAALDVLEELGITPGTSALEGALKADNRRISHADRKALQSTLEARRKKRRMRLEQQEADEAAEGAVYAAGAF